MRLAQLQALVARLCTDAETLRAFEQDPAGVALSLGLDPRAAQELADMPGDPLRLFARSLQVKRQNDVAKCLPFTQRALSSRFALLFRRYAAARQPAAEGPQLDDAAGFARYLARLCARREIALPWIGDLATYEAAGLRASVTAARLLIRRFRYPVHRLAEDSARGLTLDPSRAAQFTVVIWARLPGRSRPAQVALSAPRVSARRRELARIANES